jgi:hypothetical protein
MSIMRNVIAFLSLACVVAGAGCGSTTGPSDGPSSATVTWSVYFGTPLNGLDVSACNVVVPGGLCGQIMNVDSSGAFHEVWSPATPNLLQADGTLTTTAMSATLKCVATSASGSLSATASGSEYSGTATLGGRTVSIRIVKGSGPCP